MGLCRASNKKHAANHQHSVNNGFGDFKKPIGKPPTQGHAYATLNDVVTEVGLCRVSPTGHPAKICSLFLTFFVEWGKPSFPNRHRTFN
jgi:hypothetical protein